MAKGTVNWDSVETWQRVVAAMLATGVKIDMRQVAILFGTTYDTIENRFRKIKKEAAVLKQEVESGQRGEATPARTKATPTSTPRKPKTPKKDALDIVANGRVTKKSPKPRKSSIKQEMEEEDNFTHGLFDSASANGNLDMTFTNGLGDDDGDDYLGSLL